ncbi:MAG: Eco57I restriction-modification methylase domain-containing protein [Gemmatimonadales bacterium]
MHHLGGEAFALPVPAGDNGALRQVGLLAGLPVWESAVHPEETVRDARRLARRGMLGTLFGHNVAREQWLIAVTVQPVRLTAVQVGDITALPLRRLARAARVSRATPLDHAIGLAEALDVDAAGRRTFRLLHQLLNRGVCLLPGSIPTDDRHAWTLAQITRLLFLRFVESEGWLDGNPRFLAAAFDRCLIARRDPTRHLLHPLFFGTLNRSWEQRSRFARAFGAVPFLNGGLFEPHAVERSHRLRLPVDYWRTAFAALVDHVDVTLDGGAEDGRITPELLGRVFEGVMHPVERRQEGTFFTPPALVDGVLREALACHLAPRLQQSEAAVERSLDDPDDGLLRLLSEITVLDPAVGSGAFLVGALTLLHGPGDRQPARVRHLVTRRLFGVDRHPVAVRICELRLWLEVLRAMRGRPAGRVPPLPNLDASVRAGDALIDPLFGQEVPAAAARSIRRRHRAIAGTHGAAKRAAIAEARQAERRAVLQSLRDQEARLEHGIAELLAAARAPTLFGDHPRLSTVVRHDLDMRRHERMQLRAARRRLVREEAAMPFAIAAAFAPVIARRGGFDMVIGNPPWVRAERLSSQMRRALADRYRWWRSGTGTGWRHLPDLAVAFVERGFNLLAPSGTLALLVPAKLATAGYGSVCRSALTTRSTIHRVADLGRDRRAGFDATTYPLALVASRRAPPPGHVVTLGLGLGSAHQPQVLWQQAPGWLTVSPQAQRIAVRLSNEHAHLQEQVSPQLGVKTGANTAFLDPPEILHHWCRPAIRGRDIRPFTCSSVARLLWPANEHGVPWAELPDPVARHLAKYVAQLQRRADQQRGPWWQLFRTRAATAAHRVVWRDLAFELQATVVHNPQAVPLNTYYVAAVPSAAIAGSLAAWLNSGPIRALARMSAEPAAGGYARFAARVIGNLPLPTSVLGHPVLIALNHAAADHDVQSALDDCATDLLGLTTAERNLLNELAANRR